MSGIERKELVSFKQALKEVSIAVRQAGGILEEFEAHGMRVRIGGKIKWQNLKSKK